MWPLKDSAGHVSPRALPLELGYASPKSLSLTADGCFGGGVPTALLPCVWTSRDQLRWNSLGLPGQLEEER